MQIVVMPFNEMGFGSDEFARIMGEPKPESEPEKVPQPEVRLSGKSIAAIPIPERFETKLVIFRPTTATMNLVSEFKDCDVELSITDTNGTFTPSRAQRIVDSVYEPGNDTMIVTTEDQS